MQGKSACRQHQCNDSIAALKKAIELPVEFSAPESGSGCRYEMRDLEDFHRSRSSLSIPQVGRSTACRLPGRPDRQCIAQDKSETPFLPFPLT